MKYEGFSPHPASIASIISTVSVISAGAVILLSFFLRGILFVILCTAVSVTALFLVSFIIPLSIRSRLYIISEGRIVIRSGFIIRKTRVIKKASIQHIQYIKTALSEYTALNFLILNMYGGRAVISFLSRRDCEKLLSEMESIAA